MTGVGVVLFVKHEVVEVVARIGASVVDHRHVPHTGRYRIGSAPGVDLAIAAGALRSFPVLDEGFVFRRPAGFGDGATEIPLRAGDRVELELGIVTLELSVVPASRDVVPKRRPDLRPWAYGIAVLAVHLIVWAAAMLLEPIERLPREVVTIDPPKVRIAFEEPPVPKPEPKPEPEKTKQPAASAAAAAAGSPEQRAAEGARKAGVLAATGLSDLSSLVPTVDVAKLVKESVFYDEGAALAKQFGGGARFDPSKKAGWGTVASGKYTTVSKGRGAGDDYDLPGAVAHPQPDIAMCHRGCKVSGPVDKEVLHHAVDVRLGAIGYCYQRFARKQLRGTMRIDFTIGVDGVVHAPRGSGMPEIDECAAGVIGVIPFDPQPVPTVVSYTFAFTPYAGG